MDVGHLYQVSNIWFTGEYFYQIVNLHINIDTRSVIKTRHTKLKLHKNKIDRFLAFDFCSDYISGYP